MQSIIPLKPALNVFSNHTNSPQLASNLFVHTTPVPSSIIISNRPVWGGPNTQKPLPFSSNTTSAPTESSFIEVFPKGKLLFHLFQTS